MPLTLVMHAYTANAAQYPAVQKGIGKQYFNNPVPKHLNPAQHSESAVQLAAGLGKIVALQPLGWQVLPYTGTLVHSNSGLLFLQHSDVSVHFVKTSLQPAQPHNAGSRQGRQFFGQAAAQADSNIVCM